MRVFSVENKRSALDYLFSRGKYTDRDEHPLPWFILLDIGLPDGSGIEVLEELKKGKDAIDQDLHLIPIVILSSSDNSNDVREAYENHANSYLTKPNEKDAWKKLLKRTSMYWSKINRHPR